MAADDSSIAVAPDEAGLAREPPACTAGPAARPLSDQRLPAAGRKLHSSVGSAAGAPGLKKAESWMCEVVK